MRRGEGMKDEGGTVCSRIVVEGAYKPVARLSCMTMNGRSGGVEERRA